MSANNDMILTAPIVNPILNSQFRSGGALTVTEGLYGGAYSNLVPPIDTDTINEEQKKAVGDIVTLCKENDIEVVFIETPKSQVVMRDLNYRSIMESYRELLDDHGVQYISSEDYKFDYDNSYNFIDAIHLSYQGRVNFSENLLICDKLAQ